MKKKLPTYWCVFGLSSEPFLETVNYTRKGALEDFFLNIGSGSSWDSYNQQGFTVRRVNIIPEAQSND